MPCDCTTAPLKLQALHDRQVVHGDLNAQNVLVASNAMAQTGMTAKLADLGLSRMLVQCKTHHSTNSMGTLSHMPPGGGCKVAVDCHQGF
jgi:serine/threonine protein kinase